MPVWLKTCASCLGFFPSTRADFHKRRRVSWIPVYSIILHLPEDRLHTDRRIKTKQVYKGRRGSLFLKLVTLILSASTAVQFFNPSKVKRKIEDAMLKL